MERNEQTRLRIKKIAQERICETNINVAKTMLWFAAICLCMLLMFKFNVLKSKGLFVDITFLATPFLFATTSVWCIHSKGRGKAFQYIFTVLLAVFWFELEMMSGYKSKMLLPLIVLLSLRYYNKNLTVFTYLISTVFLFASNLANAYLYNQTGLLDLNLVSFDTTKYYGLQGFLYNNIINLEPSSAALFKNGLLLSVFPNFIYLSVITYIAMRFMRYNLLNMVAAEELAEKEANGRLEIANMKTKVMLSQIKPHFLFNTLTTIAYMCKTEPKKAEMLTNRFSQYLRNNLSSLSDANTVGFATELEAIKNYLEIEKCRFEERINAEYNIETEDFDVPVLSVQPIVENAVKHGICKKEDGGKIIISSYETPDGYCVTVKDDGVGFDKEEIKLDGIEHVGIKNVITRIENYGGTVNIESDAGVGTTVTLKFPKE